MGRPSVGQLVLIEHKYSQSVGLKHDDQVEKYFLDNWSN